VRTPHKRHDISFRRTHCGGLFSRAHHLGASLAQTSTCPRSPRVPHCAPDRARPRHPLLGEFSSLRTRTAGPWSRRELSEPQQGACRGRARTIRAEGADQSRRRRARLASAGCVRRRRTRMSAQRASSPSEWHAQHHIPHKTVPPRIRLTGIRVGDVVPACADHESQVRCHIKRDSPTRLRREVE